MNRKHVYIYTWKVYKCKYGWLDALITFWGTEIMRLFTKCCHLSKALWNQTVWWDNVQLAFGNSEAKKKQQNKWMNDKQPWKQLTASVMYCCLTDERADIIFQQIRCTVSLRNGYTIAAIFDLAKLTVSILAYIKQRNFLYNQNLKKIIHPHFFRF